MLHQEEGVAWLFFVFFLCELVARARLIVVRPLPAGTS